MKTGVIIIFHNNAKDVNPSIFIENIIKVSDLKICFVNNNSRDNTAFILEIIADRCDNVSLVNIKKTKSDISAIRAGARFMNSRYNLDKIAYVSTNLLNTKYHGLNALIHAIVDNQEDILNYNKNVFQGKKNHNSIFKSMFSLVDYLKTLKTNNAFINLQRLSKL